MVEKLLIVLLCFVAVYLLFEYLKLCSKNNINTMLINDLTHRVRKMEESIRCITMSNESSDK